jgi:hypothetical protein
MGSNRATEEIRPMMDREFIVLYWFFKDKVYW